MDDLRQKFERILTPAIDIRAPYAKVMLDKLVEATIGAAQPVARPSLPLHIYKPHKNFPWFCDDCGYPPHETLRHHQ